MQGFPNETQELLVLNDVCREMCLEFCKTVVFQMQTECKAINLCILQTWS